MLRRAPLSDGERAQLAACNWPRFGLETVTHVVEAWNAGHDCKEIGEALDLPMRSLTMTLGAVTTNAGLTLRRAGPANSQAARMERARLREL